MKFLFQRNAIICVSFLIGNYFSALSGEKPKNESGFSNLFKAEQNSKKFSIDLSSAYITDFDLDDHLQENKADFYLLDFQLKKHGVYGTESFKDWFKLPGPGNIPYAVNLFGTSVSESGTHGFMPFQIKLNYKLIPALTITGHFNNEKFNIQYIHDLTYYTLRKNYNVGGRDTSYSGLAVLNEELNSNTLGLGFVLSTEPLFNDLFLEFGMAVNGHQTFLRNLHLKADYTIYSEDVNGSNPEMFHGGVRKHWNPRTVRMQTSYNYNLQMCLRLTPVTLLKVGAEIRDNISDRRNTERLPYYNAWHLGIRYVL